MTTKTFVSDPAWIAKRTGISIGEVSDSLKKLLESGLAKVDESGVFSKTHLKVRFPTTFSKSVIREHHTSQMKRAIVELEQKITPKDFNGRLVVGFTTACNPECLDDVKNYLHNALVEAVEMFSKDPCTEVYQINLQLIPLTKKID